LLATLAVIVMAGVGTVKDVPDEPTVAPAGTNSAADSVRPGVVPESTTALVVLCFPGAGCIVCHDGYCEYTRRV
jgi:hypothetical protein